nr:uncharacterized protein LOC117275800 [Nicotiana tomentosiformis]
MHNSLPDLNETPVMQGQLQNNIGYEDDEEYPGMTTIPLHVSVIIKEESILTNIDVYINTPSLLIDLTNTFLDVDVDVECDEIYTEDYWDIGDATYECEKCGALFWYEERIRKHYNSKNLFSQCVVIVEK